MLPSNFKLNNEKPAGFVLSRIFIIKINLKNWLKLKYKQKLGLPREIT